jgi:hypothetical protein
MKRSLGVDLNLSVWDIECIERALYTECDRLGQMLRDPNISTYGGEPKAQYLDHARRLFEEFQQRVEGLRKGEGAGDRE